MPLLPPEPTENGPAPQQWIATWWNCACCVTVSNPVFMPKMYFNHKFTLPIFWNHKKIN